MSSLSCKNVKIQDPTGTLVSTLSYDGTNINIDKQVLATSYTSTVATGTAPLTVASTTLVNNLNADLLDGLHIGQTGTSYIPYVDANGNVGIGTNSPSGKLHIQSNSDVSIVIYDGRINSTDPNYRYTSSIRFDGYGPNMASIYVIHNEYSFGGAHLAMSTTGQERMRVTAGGHVLIGTTTDNGVDTLQVNGSISALTVPASTNNTQLATTAMVHSAITNDLHVTGSAPMYACRAWLNYSGSSSTINASANVSSVTKNSSGCYIMNFAVAMPDTNYVVSGSAALANSKVQIYITGASGIFKTTSIQIETATSGSTTGDSDADTLCVAIHR